VLLGLVLGSILLAAISMAFDIYLRAFDASRTGVEEARLARAILYRIGGDLRGAVRYDPQDTADLLSGLTTGLIPEEFESMAGDAEEMAGEMGLDLSLLGDDSEEASNGSEPSLGPSSTPGLRGGSDWLQVDVSRLPRIDQLRQAYSDSGQSVIRDRPGDVKTVAYWLAVPGSSSLDVSGSSGGLMRLELDRAVTDWAEQQSMLADVENELEPIAPEVVGLAFQYYDGEEWFDSWDSDELGGLPVAVEIALEIRPSGIDEDDSAADFFGGESDSGAENAGQKTVEYRLLVYLMTGGLIPPKEEAVADEETDSEQDAGDDEPDPGSESPPPSSGGPAGGSPDDPLESLRNELLDGLPADLRDRLPADLRDRIPADLLDRLPADLRDRLPGGASGGTPR